MKFNILKKSPAIVRNFEGAKAYALSPEMELYAAVVTAGLNDTFYEKDQARLLRIKQLIQKNDPEFVARLAIYTRNVMNMRSIPLVLVVELAKSNSGNPIISKAIEYVVNRADEITELLAYYQLSNQRTGVKKLNKLSKQIQKGLCLSFNKFDEYQFAKYNRDTEIKLRDALFLVHPKARDISQQEVFDKIAKNTLATPYTWEVELSMLGQNKEGSEIDKKAALKAKWEELISSGKLGYMALLRNLRNILEADVTYKSIRSICIRLSDKTAVLNSKQLPFRFLAAYREIKIIGSPYTSMILGALEAAISVSASNIRGMKDSKVLIACDVSGSMQHSISPKSKVLLFDIGLVLGMLLQSTCKRVISGMFGDTWKVINLSNNNILANVETFYKREGEVGYSTNGYKVIDYLIQKRLRMDKIMVFTDCQMWNSVPQPGSIQDSWKTYKQIAPEAKLYLFDLSGYGNTPLNILNEDVYLIAGWSEKIFDILNATENSQAALEVINNIII